MTGFTVLAHPADVGIEANGGSLAEAFEQAALGLMSIIMDVSTIEPVETREVELDAGDREQMLVRWFSEILYLYDGGRFACKEFTICTLTEGHLRAVVQGERFSEERHQTRMDVKAITYHQVAVHEADHGTKVNRVSGHLRDIIPGEHGTLRGRCEHSARGAYAPLFHDGRRGFMERVDRYRHRIPTSYKSGMRIEGMVYADEDLLRQIESDQTVEQVANVATLRGLVGRSLAMPDAHQGYGFCIGGVAAADPADGVVSAGGVGFDINCGVRLLRSRVWWDG